MNEAVVTIHVKYLLWLGGYTLSVTICFIDLLIKDSKKRNKYQEEIIKYFRRK